jgi:hypothetical protein
MVRCRCSDPTKRLARGVEPMHSSTDVMIPVMTSSRTIAPETRSTMVSDCNFTVWRRMPCHIVSVWRTRRACRRRTWHSSLWSGPEVPVIDRKHDRAVVFWTDDSRQAILKTPRHGYVTSKNTGWRQLERTSGSSAGGPHAPAADVRSMLADARRPHTLARR